MSTRRISWGKCGRCVRLTTLPPYCAVVKKSGTLTSWNPLGHPRPVTGLLYLVFKVLMMDYMVNDFPDFIRDYLVRFPVDETTIPSVP
jgi:hypothetical protein